MQIWHPELPQKAEDIDVKVSIPCLLDKLNYIMTYDEFDYLRKYKCLMQNPNQFPLGTVLVVDYDNHLYVFHANLVKNLRETTTIFAMIT